MAFRSNISAAPREEISAAIVEGASLNTQLIWQDVLPPLGLNQRTAHLPKLTIAGAELMRIIDGLRADGADYPRMTATIGDFTLNPAIRGQEIGIPLEAEMDYAHLFSLETFYARQLGQHKLSLTLEYYTAQTIFSTGNFGSATNSSVAYTTGNLDTISLVADILAALNRVRNAGEEPDMVIIPALVLERCSQGKLVKEWVAGQLAAGSEVTATALESAINKQGYQVKVKVGRAMYNSAAKGKKTLTRIWSNDYIWVGRAGYKNVAGDAGIPILDGVGATAFWEPYGLFVGETYEDKPKDQQVVRGKVSGNPSVFNANAGTLIATQYA
ncbi:MAG TPA: hypothetical protein VNQ90_15590 [Chthoniobacteraceae bacterium]|nr:hypothetical protein [Chthoniobacteraceae bacterium]